MKSIRLLILLLVLKCGLYAASSPVLTEFDVNVTNATPATKPLDPKTVLVNVSLDEMTATILPEGQMQAGQLNRVSLGKSCKSHFGNVIVGMALHNGGAPEISIQEFGNCGPMTLHFAVLSRP